MAFSRAGLRRKVTGWCSPFTAPVPPQVRGAMVSLQHERLLASLPLLCLAIAANAVAMAMAVVGDLPVWQQLAPPAIIISATLLIFYRFRTRPQAHDSAAALRQLRRAPLVTVPLGLVAGLWCVNAFIETEKYYCMTAPVFIGIAGLVSATCLLAVPRAAIGAMVATTLPIVIKMSLYHNLGVRAMAAMIVLITLLQAKVVLGKFEETVTMLTLQHKLNRLAASDPLTGLDNRLAFDTTLRGLLDRGEPVLVALSDLDGFKAANDSHGHHAGDAILTEVAARLRTHAPGALSIARLGGDEFALLYPAAQGTVTAAAELSAARAAIARPFACDGQNLLVGMSLGTALSLADGTDHKLLLRRADERLYADKAARKTLLPVRAA
ncbi:GGDEF domain-containing protein [Novosphingobium sp. B 225]|uniref:GGDEF domain-containing protein n=1 Tax=Novosphingobium sp. B 225 TaxID=1961849 RepID=UPI000B4AD0C1|nr:diguanylate cyclase [Novosphingobium sp. B 225]